MTLRSALASTGQPGQDTASPLARLRRCCERHQSSVSCRSLGYQVPLEQAAEKAGATVARTSIATMPITPKPLVGPTSHPSQPPRPPLLGALLSACSGWTGRDGVPRPAV